MIPKYFVPFVALFLFACNGDQETQTEALLPIAGNPDTPIKNDPPEAEPHQP